MLPGIYLGLALRGLSCSVDDSEFQVMKGYVMSMIDNSEFQVPKSDVLSTILNSRDQKVMY